MSSRAPSHPLSFLAAAAAAGAAAVALVAIAVLGPAGAAHAQTPQTRNLSLHVGEQTTISSDGVQSYSEGAPGIVDVRLPRDGSQFLLVALREGSTTLLLIMEDGRQVQYRITVTADAAPTAPAVVSRDNVRLDFYFVQLSDTYNHSIGIGWPGTIGGASVATFNASAPLAPSGGTVTATAVVANQALPRLDLLQSTGWARILRQAAIITASGNEASFFSGGEVNVRVAGALTAEIRRIEFGSTIRVLPHYDRETGRVELKINADVSDLTEGEVPGRTVSRLDTMVNLDAGQSLVVAGLLSESETESMTGLPWLSQIPIIGVLFGTHGRTHSQTQNLLFIVPTVVDTVSSQDTRLIQEALRQYEEYSGGLDEMHLVGDPPRGSAPRSAPAGDDASQGRSRGRR